MLSFEDELPKTDDYSHALIRFLQHGNALGEAILETMPHAIIIFNENLMVVRANLHAKRLYKRSSELFNGVSLKDIDQNFSALTIESLHKQKPGSHLQVQDWSARLLFQMDKRSYYLLYK